MAYTWMPGALTPLVSLHPAFPGLGKYGIRKIEGKVAGLWAGTRNICLGNKHLLARNPPFLLGACPYAHIHALGGSTHSLTERTGYRFDRNIPGTSRPNGTSCLPVADGKVLRKGGSGWPLCTSRGNSVTNPMGRLWTFTKSKFQILPCPDKKIKQTNVQWIAKYFIPPRIKG